MNDLPRWRLLLDAEITRTNITETAKRIGYSRSAVSTASRGKYTAGTDKFSERVLEVLGGPEEQFHCPAQDTNLTQSACAAFAASPMPTTSPYAMAKWRKCQSCPHHPAKGKDNA